MHIKPFDYKMHLREYPAVPIICSVYTEYALHNAEYNSNPE